MPTPPAAAHTPITRARPRASGAVAVARVSELGSSSAAPTPCTTCAAMSRPMPPDSADTEAAATTVAMPVRKTRRAPNVSDRVPAPSRMAAKASV